MLTKENIQALRTESSFTEEEITMLHRQFVKGSGGMEELTPEQFIGVFKLLVGAWFTKGKNSRMEGFLDFVFRAFDQNNDGLIDFRVPSSPKACLSIFPSKLTCFRSLCWAWT